MKKWLQILAVLAAVVVAALGLFALITWFAGDWSVATFGPNYVPMAPSTAVLLVLMGLALAARRRFAPENRLTGWVVLGVATVAVVAGVLVLSRETLPWDEWLVGSVHQVGTNAIGRMSPLTALLFILAALALAAQARIWSRANWVAAVNIGAVAVGLLLSIIIVLGYASGMPFAYGGDSIPMALLTALGFVTLNLALLMTKRNLQRFEFWWNTGWELDGFPFGLDSRRWLMGIVLFLMLLIGLTGILYVRSLQASAQNAAYNDLKSIAALKAQQIRQWMLERQADAQVISRTPALGAKLADLSVHRDNLMLRQELSDWLAGFRASNHYEAILVFDSHAGVLISIPEAAALDFPIPHETLLAALASGQILTSKLRRVDQGQQPRLDILVPILLPGMQGSGNGAARTAVLLRLNPALRLFPLVEFGQIPSTTMDTLLLAREGMEVACLNPLRLGGNGAKTLRSSIEDRANLMTQVALGRAGVFETQDYRGVKVLVASLAVPDTPWFLITKVDLAEIYAPLRRTAILTGAVFATLLLTGLLAVEIVGRQLRLVVLRRALAAEKERGVLAERLSHMTRLARDIVLLLDEEGRIVEANEQAVKAYGYTEAELQRLPPGGLRPPDGAGNLAAQLGQLRLPQGATFETRHQRRDGTSFPVEISGRAIESDGRAYMLVIIRDITEREYHEWQIERLNRLYAALSQVNQAIVRAADRDVLLRTVCAALVEHGRFCMAWIGWCDPGATEVRVRYAAGDRSGYLAGIRVSTDGNLPTGRGPTGTALRENTTVVFNDIAADPRMSPWRAAAERAGYKSSIGLPIEISADVRGVLTVYATEAFYFEAEEIALLEEVAQDTSFGLDHLVREGKRVQAEAALRESEDRWRFAIQGSAAGIWEVNYLTGKDFYSDRSKEILGYAPEDIPQKMEAWVALIHPEDVPIGRQAMAEHLAGRQPYYEAEHRFRCKDGTYKWISSHARAVFDADGRLLRIAGTHVDIQKRKEAEEALRFQNVVLSTQMEVSIDGVLVVGEENRIIAHNRRFIELWGLPAKLIDDGLYAPILQFVMDQVVDPRAFVERVKFLYAQQHETSQDEIQLKNGRVIDRYSAPMFGADGHYYGRIWYFHDITSRREREEKLRVALQESQALLNEVHHRVKNNLQVIISLLRLEAGQSHSSEANTLLKDMKSRIFAMALLHETLYRSGKFARVDLASYLRQVAMQLWRIQNLAPGTVELELDLQSAEVEIDHAIPCGLIVNELLTNSLKYAFPGGRTGLVRLTLQRGDDGRIRLQVADDGVGLPADFAPADFPSLGWRLVMDLTQQLQGQWTVGPGPGTKVTVVFAGNLGHSAHPLPHAPGSDQAH